MRIGIFYCMVVLGLTGCADSLILYPSTEPIRDTAARRLEIAGPVGALEIWKERSPGAIANEPKAFVLAFVGNASRAEWDAGEVAGQWGDQPVEIWAVNYPGYGGSAGSASLASIAPAALAAFDAMKQQAGNRPTFIAARSIGTTAALYVAAHRNIDGVILHSPPPLRSLIMGEFGWWNLWLAAIPVSLGVPADLDSIENAKHVTAPGVFIITEADRLVPPPYQQKIVDAYGGPKQIVALPGTDHNDPIPDSSMASLHAAYDALMHGKIAK